MALVQPKTKNDRYRSLGQVGQYPELWTIWSAIIMHLPSFKLPNGKEISTKQFKGGDLWAVDLDGKRYVEQNPHTRSAYAARAGAGAKIVWIIRLADNEYLGYIEDGEVWRDKNQE